MKNKKIKTMLIIILVILLATFFVLLGVYLPKLIKGSTPPGEEQPGEEDKEPPTNPEEPGEQFYSLTQNLNYNESIEKINNPDQGFYFPIIVRINENGKVSSQDHVLEWNSDEAKYQLYHLRIDISAFSKQVNKNEDIKLTSKALDYLNEELALFKSKGKNVIIRFSYHPNYDGAFNSLEPSFNMLLEHAEQVLQVINNYESTITAMEAGFIGSWGEMTSNSSYMNATYYNQLIDKLLSNTNNIPILVRTPNMIYDYAKVSANDVKANKQIELNEKTKQLGLYNDAFMKNWNDLGTYTNLDGVDGNSLRYTHIEFLKQFTNNTPFGGEALKPNGVLSYIDNCLPEMNDVNLSYLNGIYDSEVINMWKNQTYNSSCEMGDNELYYNESAFTYIQNHMGYRLVLKNSTFNYSSKFNFLKVDLNIDNVGFGNFNKQKNVKLIFVDSNNQVVFQKQVGTYLGEKSISYQTDINLNKGSYKVYLAIYSGEINNEEYFVRFANRGENSFNKTFNANLVGEITVGKK